MAQYLVDFLMLRLRSAGLAHMHRPAIAALQRGRHTPLRGQRLAQRQPTVVDALGLELQSQHVHEVVGQHADEQMPFDPAVDAVEYRVPSPGRS